MTNIFDRICANGNSREELPEGSAAQSRDLLSDGVNGEDSSEHTPAEIKAVVQELLKFGFIEEASRNDLFRRLITNTNAINAILEPLDLQLRVDTIRGIAFLAIAQLNPPNSAEEEGWSHPLVRRQRLTLEQSLLVAILRQVYVMHEQELGVGQGVAQVAVDDLLPQFLTYFGDSGSDARNESRLLNLLDQLKTYGIVSEVDKKHEIIIRPLIAHLANPESLAALLTVLREQLTGEAAQENEES